jgi:hypothetical protein
VTVVGGVPLAVMVMVGAGEGEAVGLRVAIVSGGAVDAGGAAWAMSSPATPRMAATMTTARGQSSLFMITHSVALPGLVAPAGH